MGGQCCGFVKSDNSQIINQVQFSSEIEENLYKLERERMEAQETSSQIGNHINVNGSVIGYQGFQDGKEIGNHQSNLSNEIQKQRSVDAMLFKKETVYEDYEVRVVEPSHIRESARKASSQVDKSMTISSQKDLMIPRTSEKHPSFLGIKKQESIIQNGKMSQSVGVEEVHLEPIVNSIVLNNMNNSVQEKKDTSFKEEEEDKNPENYPEPVSIISSSQQQLSYVPQQSELKESKKLNIQIINPSQTSQQSSPAVSPAISPSSAQSQSPVPSPTAQMKDQFLQGGGKKSILLNTLTKKDDPNSGSKSILTSEDQIEKKKDKRVTLVTTPDKRFDSEQGKETADNHPPSKPKGVLKKYDPNASSLDTDSPKNKIKKKVKFKESTFKKQSKKKKM